MSSTANSSESTELSAPLLLTDADIDAVSGGSALGDFFSAIGGAIVAVGTAIQHFAKAIQ